MFEYVPTEYARIFFIVCLIALAVIALVCLVRAIWVLNLLTVLWQLI